MIFTPCPHPNHLLFQIASPSLRPSVLSKAPGLKKLRPRDKEGESLPDCSQIHSLPFCSTSQDNLPIAKSISPAPLPTGIQLDLVNWRHWMEIGEQEERRRVFLPLCLCFRQHAWLWLLQLHGCSSCRATSHWPNLTGSQLARESGKCRLQISPLFMIQSRTGEEWGLDLRTNSQMTSTEGWTKNHWGPL